MAESDLTKQLEGLLNNPEALAGVMKMASSLMGSIPGTEKADSDSVKESGNENPPENDNIKNEASAPDLSSALPAIAGLMSKSTADDPRCTLLYALKPYMSHSRAERIDMIVKMLKLMRAAGGFMQNGGLF